MKQLNLTSTPAGISGSHLKRWPKLHVRIFQLGRIVWPRLFACALLLSSILLSPVGSIPAHALNVPDLLGPTNGLTTTVVNFPPLGIPEFTWAAVPGATNYRIQISGDIAFTTLILDVATKNTSYTPTSAGAFSDGIWYWRVRVEEPSPVGAYSSIWGFTKQWATSTNSPTLTAPANSAMVDFYDSPVFSWNPVTGAARYRIQIYSSPGGWSSPLYNATTLATTHQPINKLTNGTYYWRVVPVDPGNRDGTPSLERTFTAGYYSVPTLLEPLDNATPVFTPTFRWTAIRGAQYYRLQYTTDPAFATGITQIDTPNTTYTPTNAMPNDVNYYWRVRVHSGNSISNWTQSRTFKKKWYIKPVNLTPTNLYQDQRFPTFSWTPVPGASVYKIDMCYDPNCTNSYNSNTTSNTFYTPQYYSGAPSTTYWQVTPYDANGQAGIASNITSYNSYGSSVSPDLVYPFYYYPPDNYLGFTGVVTHPHEDRTVPLPIFIWHRIYSPPPSGQVYAQAYRLQVSTDPFFDSVDWIVDTQNLTATPTASNPFTPLPNTNYYWRVCPLIGVVCPLNIYGREPWSQTWKTRFDSALGLAPTTGGAPVLISPADGFEFAETTPLLEWFPLSGAATYDVQISLDQSFGSTVDTATVSYPVYAPTQSLAQRSLGAVNFGIYYWRVRKSGAGNAWSATQRFQIAAQSQWQETRTVGNASNQLQIGSDPAVGSGDGTTDPDYDLTNLQVAQSSASWFFGFHVPNAPSKNVTYALYLDLDHQNSSGATYDARGYNVTTIPAYRPEFAIYVLQQSGLFYDTKVYLYGWNGSSWDLVGGGNLASVGGHLNKTGDYVELQVPNTAIGYQNNTGSYAVSLLSLPALSGQVQDSVPSDPNVPGSGLISRFSNVTERMNLVMPPNDAGVDPSTFSSVPPFFWDWPVLSPWAGAREEVHLDPGYTNNKANYDLTSDTPYYAPTSYASPTDLVGDNTYYWRIQPKYRLLSGNYYFGVWSQPGWRFERQGFLPQNLLTSVTFATPTFSWDMVEGAQTYELQIDDDPSFNSTAIDITTAQNSYTDLNTLPEAFYYWRVRVNRNGSVTNSWTTPDPLCPAPGHLVGCFDLKLPTPTDLTPATTIPPTVVGRAPTLCWTPVIKISPAGDPVLAAWRYHVQVSKDPTFTSIYESADTEQRCWTSTIGYDEGQYYWRVSMVDGVGRVGAYSAYQTFVKQYPMTTLVSPTSGATLATTPTFVWTPVNGAARYLLEISQFSTFSPMYLSVTTDNTRFTPGSLFDIQKTYYWRVAIIDGDGRLGPFVGATIILDPVAYRIFLPLVMK